MQGRVPSNHHKPIHLSSTWLSKSEVKHPIISIRPKDVQMAKKLTTLSAIIETATCLSQYNLSEELLSINLSIGTLLQHVETAMSQTLTAPDPAKLLPIPATIRSAILAWADAQNQSVNDVLPSITQFYHQLPPAVQDPILMALLRAELQSDDSLMSFLDHEIAIRGSLTNDDAVYLPNIDDVMADHHAFFDIVSLDPLDALSSNDEHQSSRERTYKQQQCLNVIDFILFELLLEEQLPLGLIRFRLIPRQSNKTECVLDLCVYHKHLIVTELSIRYANQTDIWVTRGEKLFAHLNLNLKSGRVYRINGHIQNKAFLCHYSRSDTSRLKLSISQWRTTLKFSQTNRDLTGTWKKPNGDQKCFQLRGKRRRIGGNTHHSYRAQLGEDAIQAVYQFPKTGKRTSPIPLAGTGAILNNAFAPHTAIVVPYPTWTLGL